MVSGDPRPSVDLEHNRRGELSPAQARVVISMDYGTMMASFAAPMIAVTLLGAAISVAYRASPVLALVVLGAVGVPAAIASLWVTRTIRRGAATRARARRLRAVDGFVAWTGSAWTAFEGTVGAPKMLVPAVLPPGPYRFYLYESTLVGAESPLGPGSFSITQILRPSSMQLVPGDTTSMTPLPLADPQALLSAMATAVGFTMEDLEANRRGNPSVTQGQRFQDATSLSGVEGPVQLRWVMPNKLTVNQSLVVGTVEIPIPPSIGRVVVPGLSYRIYRSASSGRILSLEPSAPTLAIHPHPSSSLPRGSGGG